MLSRVEHEKRYMTLRHDSFKALYCYGPQLSYGPRREKTCLQGFANNNGADQPAHQRSLISAFFIMPPKELWEAYSNHTVRPSVCPSHFRVRSISPLFFELGISN